MKKEWKKPTIEMVPLEFDKVMDSACHGTSSVKYHPGKCELRDSWGKLLD